MVTDTGPSASEPSAVLADRLFHDVIGALELFTVYLGERLGLYRALSTRYPPPLPRVPPALRAS